MKYIRKFEIRYSRKEREERNVFWVSSFDKDMEDSLMQLYFKYVGYDDMVDKIGKINTVLEICSTARESFSKKTEYVLITMKYYVDEFDEVSDPYFDISRYDQKELLEKQKYIYVGLAPNTDKERYDMYIDTKKYNL